MGFFRRWSKTDSYVSVLIEGEMQRTDTLEDTGANPVWGEGHDETLRFYPMAVGVPMVKVVCWVSHLFCSPFLAPVVASSGGMPRAQRVTQHGRACRTTTAVTTTT